MDSADIDRVDFEQFEMVRIGIARDVQSEIPAMKDLRRRFAGCIVGQTKPVGFVRFQRKNLLEGGRVEPGLGHFSHGAGQSFESPLSAL